MKLSWVSVEGTSMSPFLNPDELIGVQWFHSDVRDLELGELVLIHTDSLIWIVHRLIYEERIGSQTVWGIKGDRSTVIDRVSPEQIWGRVRAIQDKNGRKRLFRTTPFDRWIAFLSKKAISSRMDAKVLRRLVPALARTRKAFL